MNCEMTVKLWKEFLQIIKLNVLYDRQTIVKQRLQYFKYIELFDTLQTIKLKLQLCFRMIVCITIEMNLL